MAVTTALFPFNIVIPTISTDLAGIILIAVALFAVLSSRRPWWAASQKGAVRAVGSGNGLL
jgi:hypothetical protein